MSRKINPEAFGLADLKTYDVGALQASAHRALRKHGDQLLKEYEITNMQWHLIGAVLDAGEAGVRISDLAKMLDTTMAFLTNNVNLLESKGILARVSNATDGRSRLVHVAPDFLPKCEKIEVALRRHLRQSIYASITPQELHTYVKVLLKLGEINNTRPKQPTSY